MKEPRNDAGLYTLTRTNTLDTNQGGASAGVSRALQLGDGEPGNGSLRRSLARVCSKLLTAPDFLQNGPRRRIPWP